MESSASHTTAASLEPLLLVSQQQGQVMFRERKGVGGRGAFLGGGGEPEGGEESRGS